MLPSSNEKILTCFYQNSESKLIAHGLKVTLNNNNEQIIDSFSKTTTIINGAKIREFSDILCDLKIMCNFAENKLSDE